MKDGVKCHLFFQIVERISRTSKSSFSFPRQYTLLIFIRNSHLAVNKEDPMSHINNIVLTS